MAFLKEYTLLEELGKGGFATVYKVKHNALGYIRAIRVLNEVINSEDSPAYQKFLRECKVLLRLGNGNHKNIVHIYQPRFLENHALVEMDYVDGCDISKYLRANGNFLPTEEVLRMVEEMSGALAYCHEDIYKYCMDRDEDHLVDDPNDGSKVLIDNATKQRLIEKYKVIHNDIHSGNIMRRDDGSFVLLDFGLAITGNDDVRHSSRHDNGAIEFKAPEKWDNEALLTEQTDIYSFGVVMYEYLAGRVPFQFNKKALNLTEEEFKLSREHKLEQAPAIYDIRKANFEAKYPDQTYEKDYPDWLEEAIMKCLEKDPSKRFRNGKELHDFVVKHIKKGSDGVESRDERVESGDDRVESRDNNTENLNNGSSGTNKNRKLVLWLALAIVAIAIGVAVLVFSPSSATKETESTDHIAQVDPDILAQGLELVEVDNDTEMYNSCKNINEYRNYIAYYGRSGKHYKDAKQKIDKHVADSTKKAQDEIKAEQARKVEKRRKEQEEKARKEAEAKAFSNKTFTVNGVSFDMIAVKGGTFTMGGTSEQGSDAYDSEKPTHSVTLSDYYIGKFEVTQELWRAVMGNEPTYNDGWTKEYGRGNNYPAYRISWNDCQEFIKKLNQKTGANFRLPTEAEWEYAARGGNKSKGYKYSGSNTIGNVEWYSSSKTHQVGTKSPNELGIYDMSGNVLEWCQDWYGDYSSGSQTNPTGPSSGFNRVSRGGSWSEYAMFCRVSCREYNTPDARRNHLGFRLALDNNPKSNNSSSQATGSKNTSKDGVFSVSSSKKVQFSQGNLQYQASTKTWRFAEHQWDMIGDANKNISSSYSGWIDLFGWGTSGYNGKNPWMTSTTNTDYGNGENDIAGTSYDWGVYNTISNGKGKSWRTLTNDEWVYVFNTRNTNSGIRYAKANVNGVNGVILLPDNWSKNTYSLSNTNKTDANFNSNTISQTDWTNKFEANGAVFLPAAGCRYGTNVNYVGSNGNYWSASYYDSGDARYVSFRDGNLNPDDWYYRKNGRSVRLVCSAEN